MISADQLDNTYTVAYETKRCVFTTVTFDSTESDNPSATWTWDECLDYWEKLNPLYPALAADPEHRRILVMFGWSGPLADQDLVDVPEEWHSIVGHTAIPFISVVAAHFRNFGGWLA